MVDANNSSDSFWQVLLVDYVSESSAKLKSIKGSTSSFAIR